MSSLLSVSLAPNLHSRRLAGFFSPEPRRKSCNFRRNAQNPKSPIDRESQSDNALLKVAWYGSELLGIAASFFRPRPQSVAETADVELDGLGVIDRGVVVETIKEDFGRSYFVTGNLTLNAYEEDCEFADPAGSFRGLRRFKRNCTNFGSLLEKSDMKLTKWEDFEDILNTISLNLEECAGMWNTGMFQKWHCSSKYSHLAMGHGVGEQALEYQVEASICSAP
ncbi:uncharacterized protein LOC131232814 isoform X4 [Magnolia sinica]|uniref:uncharacterized protein LOC131232814 isoform X4 n=1 Tax=Magnolia sinica TaxID=86752 RepID=UPI00265A0494|nr:uncharacterized protein LOC131232814 isoform X4 [Magnolia sinica]